MGWTPPTCQRRCVRLEVVTDQAKGDEKTFFTNHNVTQVEPTDVQELVNHFDNAQRSARKHKSILSKFFGWATLVKRLRTDNPCRDVKVEGGKKKLMVWSADLFHSIRDALGKSDETEVMALPYGSVVPALPAVYGCANT